ncbi:hypothetical protein AB0J43_15455 [Nonomuraea fuscirosea]
MPGVCRDVLVSAAVPALWMGSAVSAAEELSPALDWRPYDSRGTRSRVREYVTRGKVEFELCSEGGQEIIRRTDRSGKRPVVSEVGRSLTHRDTVDLWKLVMMGDVG